MLLISPKKAHNHLILKLYIIYDNFNSPNLLDQNTQLDASNIIIFKF